MRFSVLPILVAAMWCASSRAGETQYPKWDGKETVEQYAQRAKLPATKTLDLGDGVTLETVLVPAGDFVMGAAEPAPVDENVFERKKWHGQIAVVVAISLLGIAGLLVIGRAAVRKRQPQYSLRLALLMVLIASVGVWGGTRWWQSFEDLKQAHIDYAAAVAGYNLANADEKPAREVSLSRPFYMGKIHVTQAQYEKVAGKNLSRFPDPKLPIDKVTWEAAKEFCKFATERTKQPVRLPTEAEWEFACRAGTRSSYYSGESEADLDRIAWFYKNSGKTPHPGGQKQPNKFGLYDMLGNNWQWCQRYNPTTRAEEQPDVSADAVRVVRGGSWDDAAKNCRVTAVFRYFPDYRPMYVGMRVVVPVMP